MPLSRRDDRAVGARRCNLLCRNQTAGHRFLRRGIAGADGGRPGRASLALDLMEELRPVLADRLALSLINRRQLAADDFIVEEAGGVRLTDEARKRVLVAWQERKRDELRHPLPRRDRKPRPLGANRGAIARPKPARRSR